MVIYPLNKKIHYTELEYNPFIEIYHSWWKFRCYRKHFLFMFYSNLPSAVVPFNKPTQTRLFSPQYQEAQITFYYLKLFTMMTKILILPQILSFSRLK
jgi:hypothetical protein